MSANDSAEELQGKLAGYTMQLSQIENILQADPNNEQLIKLRDDLSTLIEMTEKLYAAAVESEGRQRDHGKTEPEEVDPRSLLWRLLLTRQQFLYPHKQLQHQHQTQQHPSP